MTSKKPSRREQAQATRRRIVVAAHDEFTERGFHGATMAGIAARAEVATQTVYFVFHTKAELISAVIDHAVMGDDDRAPQDTEWWSAMVDEPDAASALRWFIQGAGPIFARAAAISEVLRAAALTDDEIRGTYERHESMRRDGYREALELVSQKGTLRPGRTLDEATDVLLTVFGDSTYHLFATDCGWSHDHIIEWYNDSLPRLLLGP
jgi:AcrR family transcriptional regulator